jgi:hypothetical protein
MRRVVPQALLSRRYSLRRRGIFRSHHCAIQYHLRDLYYGTLFEQRIWLLDLN